MDIKDYGWNEHFAEEQKERATSNMSPGRIIGDYGQMVRVITNEGEFIVNRPVQSHEEGMQMAEYWLFLTGILLFLVKGCYNLILRKSHRSN